MTLEEIQQEYPKWNEIARSSCKDLTNQSFNKLVVLYRSAANDNKNAAWICQCSCGAICRVRGSHLTTGKIDACPQCRSQKQTKASYIDETGKCYGQLIVLHKDDLDIKSGQAKWICQCSCGNIVSVYGWNLRSGRSQSCGCNNSRGETIVAEILTEMGLEFKTQYTFDDCVGINNNKYRFDFGIIQNNKLVALIEYDGIQHFHPSSDAHSWNTTESVLDTQYRDSVKNQYCQLHNIPLLRIPHTHNTKEVIGEDIHQFISCI